MLVMELISELKVLVIDAAMSDVQPEELDAELATALLTEEDTVTEEDTAETDDDDTGFGFAGLDDVVTGFGFDEAAAADVV